MVYIVTCLNEICFVADNERDVLKYLARTPESGYSHHKFREEVGIEPYMWLNDGHTVDEITMYLDNDFQIDQYHLGYDYRWGSPYYLKKIIKEN